MAQNSQTFFGKQEIAQRRKSKLESITDAIGGQ